MMNTYQKRAYELREKTSHSAQRRMDDKPLAGNRLPLLDQLDIRELVQGLLRRFGKLWTALRFRFHQLTAGVFEGVRLPWFKLGLAAFAFFLLSRKDIQLSVNMRSPLAMQADNEERSGNDQMGMARPMSLRGAAATVATVSDLDERRVRDYIQRFGKVAQAEQDRYGMPASIKMAQALLESRAGALPAEQGSNNHFGAPLSGQAYENAWENWRAHSLFVVHTYPALIETGGDYHAWAAALQRSGYSQDARYAHKLVQAVEDFRLHELD